MESCQGLEVPGVHHGDVLAVTLVVVGILATRKNSLDIWVLYPCFVFALQGAAWLVAYMLRKQLWLLAVGLGWFASAIVLGIYIGTLTYLLIAGLSLIFLMALPVLIMMRLARVAD